MKVVELQNLVTSDAFITAEHDAIRLHRSTSEHLDRIAGLIKQSKKTIILTGAGISSNAGIPDFRSKEGLYSLIKARYPKNVVSGRDLFDSMLFHSETTTRIFYVFMSELRRAILTAKATTTHLFIKLLADKGKLLRNYTQNIDGLESKADIDMKSIDAKVVQLHGDLHTLKCVICRSVFEYDDENLYMNVLADGDAPPCPNCEVNDQCRKAIGKRSVRMGYLRPNIVLYGESHPSADLVYKTTLKDVAKRPDLFIIMGTSLKVSGVKHLAKTIAKAVHARGAKVVFVNKSPVSTSEWAQYVDYFVQSDTDAWVHDLKTRIPDLWLTQTTLQAIQKKPSNRGKKNLNCMKDSISQAYCTSIEGE